jgi:hypothetical protein
VAFHSPLVDHEGLDTGRRELVASRTATNHPAAAQATSPARRQHGPDLILQTALVLGLLSVLVLLVIERTGEALRALAPDRTD